MPKATGVFYTYMWLREDGTPYYVGKGIGARAFVKHRGKTPPSIGRILVQEHPSEEDAFAAEIFFIAYYGRKDLGTGILINRASGGEGGSVMTGKKHSDETKLKIGNANRGRKGAQWSEERKEEQSKRMTGQKLSDSWKLSMSRVRLGKPRPDLKGRVKSEEERKKISIAKIGKPRPDMCKPLSEETKRRISQSSIGKPGTNTGKKFSEETKRKMSESAKARMALKREEKSAQIFNG